MKKAFFRFYEELNDFLPAKLKKIRFDLSFEERTSIKDMIESIGIPHTEIDLILVNNNSVNFNYIVKDDDDISVYPVFESFDISEVQHLRPKPLRNPKFILDVHLGKLAKLMRILGIDTFYQNNFEDKEIVKLSLEHKRSILTRDIGLLKRKEVNHGYFVRNRKAEEQVLEVIERFQLKKIIKPFTRCIECNAILYEVKKENVVERLPQKVKNYLNEFYICKNCDKIFWKGTHYQKMSKMLERLNSKNKLYNLN
jgi:uncharacterized protein